jgi:hypothetical protein
VSRDVSERVERQWVELPEGIHIMTDRDPHATDIRTEKTGDPNLSTEHQEHGDARLPSDRLDKDQAPPEETIPRKASLT